MTGLVLGGSALFLLLLAAGRTGGSVADEKTPGILDGLNAEARAAANRLGVLAAAEAIPLTWTSGRRSGVQQASAMLYKLDAGEDLYKLYPSARAVLDELFDLPQTVQIWGEVLDRRPISAHQRGEAGDVRRWGLTPDQLKRLAQLAIEAGWRRTLLERDHLHLQL